MFRDEHFVNLCNLYYVYKAVLAYRLECPLISRLNCPTFAKDIQMRFLC